MITMLLAFIEAVAKIGAIQKLVTVVMTTSETKNILLEENAGASNAHENYFYLLVVLNC